MESSNLARKRAMACKARNRSKRYRQRRATLKLYENTVRSEIQKRENVQEHAIDTPHSVTDDGNMDQSNEGTLDLKEKIISWAVKHAITKRALNDLLSILITFGFDMLPKDSRTLMKTPKRVEIRELSSGHLWYFGIKKWLELIFHNLQNAITINLDFNFDGVDPFNSSRKCFWPIISSIRGREFMNIVYVYSFMCIHFVIHHDVYYRISTDRAICCWNMVWSF